MFENMACAEFATHGPRRQRSFSASRRHDFSTASLNSLHKCSSKKFQIHGQEINEVFSLVADVRAARSHDILIFQRSGSLLGCLYVRNPGLGL